MCDLCGMSSCPPACPSFEGELAGMGHAVGRCALCDGTVHSDERVLVKGGALLCEECAEAADVGDILDLEGAESVWELLCERLGWCPRVY